jgi:hypothetical protein
MYSFVTSLKNVYLSSSFPLSDSFPCTGHFSDAEQDSVLVDTLLAVGATTPARLNAGRVVNVVFTGHFVEQGLRVLYQPQQLSFSECETFSCSIHQRCVRGLPLLHLLGRGDASD